MKERQIQVGSYGKILNLTDLIKTENELRTEFRQKLEELNQVLTKVNKHQNECKQFWEINIADDVNEFIASKINEDFCMVITRPDVEPCKTETFLPYEINYKQLEVIKISQ